LEDGISVHRTWIALGEFTVGDHVAAVRFDDTDDDAKRLFLMIVASYEDLADLVGASNWNAPILAVLSGLNSYRITNYLLSLGSVERSQRVS
jgi:hypothetical protein